MGYIRGVDAGVARVSIRARRCGGRALTACRQAGAFHSTSSPDTDCKQ